MICGVELVLSIRGLISGMIGFQIMIMLFILTYQLEKPCIITLIQKNGNNYYKKSGQA